MRTSSSAHQIKAEAAAKKKEEERAASEKKYTVPKKKNKDGHQNGVNDNNTNESLQEQHRGQPLGSISLFSKIPSPILANRSQDSFYYSFCGSLTCIQYGALLYLPLGQRQPSSTNSSGQHNENKNSNLRENSYGINNASSSLTSADQELYASGSFTFANSFGQNNNNYSYYSSNSNASTNETAVHRINNNNNTQENAQTQIMQQPIWVCSTSITPTGWCPAFVDGDSPQVGPGWFGGCVSNFVSNNNNSGFVVIFGGLGSDESPRKKPDFSDVAAVQVESRPVTGEANSKNSKPKSNNNNNTTSPASSPLTSPTNSLGKFANARSQQQEVTSSNFNKNNKIQAAAPPPPLLPTNVCWKLTVGSQQREWIRVPLPKNSISLAYAASTVMISDDSSVPLVGSATSSSSSQPIDGRILIHGGLLGDGVTPNRGLFLLDATDEKNATIIPLVQDTKIALMSHKIVLVDGLLLLFGGFDAQTGLPNYRLFCIPLTKGGHVLGNSFLVWDVPPPLSPAHPNYDEDYANDDEDDHEGNDHDEYDRHNHYQEGGNNNNCNYRNNIEFQENDDEKKRKANSRRRHESQHPHSWAYDHNNAKILWFGEKGLVMSRSVEEVVQTATLIISHQNKKNKRRNDNDDDDDDGNKEYKPIDYPEVPRHIQEEDYEWISEHPSLETFTLGKTSNKQQQSQLKKRKNYNAATAGETNKKHTTAAENEETVSQHWVHSPEQNCVFVVTVDMIFGFTLSDKRWFSRAVDRKRPENKFNKPLGATDASTKDGRGRSASPTSQKNINSSSSASQVPSLPVIASSRTSSSTANNKNNNHVPASTQQHRMDKEAQQRKNDPEIEKHDNVHKLMPLPRKFLLSNKEQRQHESEILARMMLDKYRKNSNNNNGRAQSENPRNEFSNNDVKMIEDNKNRNNNNNRKSNGIRSNSARLPSSSNKLQEKQQLQQQQKPSTANSVVSSSQTPRPITNNNNSNNNVNSRPVSKQTDKTNNNNNNYQSRPVSQQPSHFTSGGTPRHSAAKSLIIAAFREAILESQIKHEQQDQEKQKQQQQNENNNIDIDEHEQNVVDGNKKKPNNNYNNKITVVIPVNGFLDPFDAIALASLVQETPSLKCLDLGGCILDDNGAKSLCEAIRKSPHVTKILCTPENFGKRNLNGYTVEEQQQEGDEEFDHHDDRGDDENATEENQINNIKQSRGQKWANELQNLAEQNSAAKKAKIAERRERAIQERIEAEIEAANPQTAIDRARDRRLRFYDRQRSDHGFVEALARTKLEEQELRDLFRLQWQFEQHILLSRVIRRILIYTFLEAIMVSHAKRRAVFEEKEVEARQIVISDEDIELKGGFALFHEKLFKMDRRFKEFKKEQERQKNKFYNSEHTARTLLQKEENYFWFTRIRREGLADRQKIVAVDQARELAREAEIKRNEAHRAELERLEKERLEDIKLRMMSIERSLADVQKEDKQFRETVDVEEARARKDVEKLADASKAEARRIERYAARHQARLDAGAKPQLFKFLDFKDTCFVPLNSEHVPLLMPGSRMTMEISKPQYMCFKTELEAGEISDVDWMERRCRCRGATIDVVLGSNPPPAELFYMLVQPRSGSGLRATDTLIISNATNKHVAIIYQKPQSIHIEVERDYASLRVVNEILHSICIRNRSRAQFQCNAKIVVQALFAVPKSTRPTRKGENIKNPFDDILPPPVSSPLSILAGSMNNKSGMNNSNNNNNNNNNKFDSPLSPKTSQPALANSPSLSKFAAVSRGVAMSAALSISKERQAQYATMYAPLEKPTKHAQNGAVGVVDVTPFKIDDIINQELVIRENQPIDSDLFMEDAGAVDDLFIASTFSMGSISMAVKSHPAVFSQGDFAVSRLVYTTENETLLELPIVPALEGINPDILNWENAIFSGDLGPSVDRHDFVCFSAKNLAGGNSAVGGGNSSLHPSVSRTGGDLSDGLSATGHELHDASFAFGKSSMSLDNTNNSNRRESNAASHGAAAKHVTASAANTSSSTLANKFQQMQQIGAFTVDIGGSTIYCGGSAVASIVRLGCFVGSSAQLEQDQNEYMDLVEAENSFGKLGLSNDGGDDADGAESHTTTNTEQQQQEDKVSMSTKARRARKETLAVMVDRQRNTSTRFVIVMKTGATREIVFALLRSIAFINTGQDGAIGGRRELVLSMVHPGAGVQGTLKLEVDVVADDEPSVIDLALTPIMCRSSCAVSDDLLPHVSIENPCYFAAASIVYDFDTADFSGGYLLVTLRMLEGEQESACQMRLLPYVGSPIQLSNPAGGNIIHEDGPVGNFHYPNSRSIHIKFSEASIQVVGAIMRCLAIFCPPDNGLVRTVALVFVAGKGGDPVKMSFDVKLEDALVQHSSGVKRCRAGFQEEEPLGPFNVDSSHGFFDGGFLIFDYPSGWCPEDRVFLRANSSLATNNNNNNPGVVRLLVSPEPSELVANSSPTYPNNSNSNNITSPTGTASRSNNNGSSEMVTIQSYSSREAQKLLNELHAFVVPAGDRTLLNANLINTAPTAKSTRGAVSSGDHDIKKPPPFNTKAFLKRKLADKLRDVVQEKQRVHEEAKFRNLSLLKRHCGFIMPEASVLAAKHVLVDGTKMATMIEAPNCLVFFFDGPKRFIPTLNVATAETAFGNVPQAAVTTILDRIRFRGSWGNKIVRVLSMDNQPHMSASAIAVEIGMPDQVTSIDIFPSSQIANAQDHEMADLLDRKFSSDSSPNGRSGLNLIGESTLAIIVNATSSTFEADAAGPMAARKRIFRPSSIEDTRGFCLFEGARLANPVTFVFNRCVLAVNLVGNGQAGGDQLSLLPPQSQYERGVPPEHIVSVAPIGDGFSAGRHLHGSRSASRSGTPTSAAIPLTEFPTNIGASSRPSSSAPNPVGSASSPTTNGNNNNDDKCASITARILDHMWTAVVLVGDRVVGRLFLDAPSVTGHSSVLVQFEAAPRVIDCESITSHFDAMSAADHGVISIMDVQRVLQSIIYTNVASKPKTGSRVYNCKITTTDGVEGKLNTILSVALPVMSIADPHQFPVLLNVSAFDDQVDSDRDNNNHNNKNNSSPQIAKNKNNSNTGDQTPPDVLNSTRTPAWSAFAEKSQQQPPLVAATALNPNTSKARDTTFVTSTNSALVQSGVLGPQKRKRGKSLTRRQTVVRNPVQRAAEDDMIIPLAKTVTFSPREATNSGLKKCTLIVEIFPPLGRRGEPNHELEDTITFGGGFVMDAEANANFGLFTNSNNNHNNSPKNASINMNTSSYHTQQQQQQQNQQVSLEGTGMSSPQSSSSTFHDSSACNEIIRSFLQSGQIFVDIDAKTVRDDENNNMSNQEMKFDESGNLIPPSNSSRHASNQNIKTVRRVGSRRISRVGSMVSASGARRTSLQSQQQHGSVTLTDVPVVSHNGSAIHSSDDDDDDDSDDDEEEEEEDASQEESLMIDDQDGTLKIERTGGVDHVGHVSFECGEGANKPPRWALTFQLVSVLSQSRLQKVLRSLRLVIRRAAVPTLKSVVNHVFLCKITFKTDETSSASPGHDKLYNPAASCSIDSPSATRKTNLVEIAGVTAKPGRTYGDDTTSNMSVRSTGSPMGSLTTSQAGSGFLAGSTVAQHSSSSNANDASSGYGSTIISPAAGSSEQNPNAYEDTYTIPIAIVGIRKDIRVETIYSKAPKTDEEQQIAMMANSTSSDPSLAASRRISKDSRPSSQPVNASSKKSVTAAARRLKSVRGSALQLLRSNTAANLEANDADTWSIFDKLGAGYVIRGSNVRSRIFSSVHFNVEETARAMIQALGSVFDDLHAARANGSDSKINPNQLVAWFSLDVESRLPKKVSSMLTDREGAFTAGNHGKFTERAGDVLVADTILDAHERLVSTNPPPPTNSAETTNNNNNATGTPTSVAMAKKRFSVTFLPQSDFSNALKSATTPQATTLTPTPPVVGKTNNTSSTARKPPLQNTIKAANPDGGESVILPARQGFEAFFENSEALAPSSVNAKPINNNNNDDDDGDDDDNERPPQSSHQTKFDQENSTTGLNDTTGSNPETAGAGPHRRSSRSTFASAASAVLAVNLRSRHNADQSSPPPFLNVQRVELQRLCLRGKLRARHFDYYEDVEALAIQFLKAAEQLLSSMTLQPEPRVTCLSRQSERWVSVKLAVNTLPVSRLLNPNASGAYFHQSASADFANRSGFASNSNPNSSSPPRAFGAFEDSNTAFHSAQCHQHVIGLVKSLLSLVPAPVFVRNSIQRSGFRFKVRAPLEGADAQKISARDRAMMKAAAIPSTAISRKAPSSNQTQAVTQSILLQPNLPDPLSTSPLSNLQLIQVFTLKPRTGAVATSAMSFRDGATVIVKLSMIPFNAAIPNPPWKYPKLVVDSSTVGGRLNKLRDKKMDAVFPPQYIPQSTAQAVIDRKEILVENRRAAIWYTVMPHMTGGRMVTDSSVMQSSIIAASPTNTSGDKSVNPNGVAGGAKSGINFASAAAAASVSAERSQNNKSPNPNNNQNQQQSMLASTNNDMNLSVAASNNNNNNSSEASLELTSSPKFTPQESNPPHGLYQAILLHIPSNSAGISRTPIVMRFLQMIFIDFSDHHCQNAVVSYEVQFQLIDTGTGLCDMHSAVIHKDPLDKKVKAFPLAAASTIASQVTTKENNKKDGLEKSTTASPHFNNNNSHDNNVESPVLNSALTVTPTSNAPFHRKPSMTPQQYLEKRKRRNDLTGSQAIALEHKMREKIAKREKRLQSMCGATNNNNSLSSPAMAGLPSPSLSLAQTADENNNGSNVTAFSFATNQWKNSNNNNHNNNAIFNSPPIFAAAPALSKEPSEEDMTSSTDQHLKSLSGASPNSSTISPHNNLPLLPRKPTMPYGGSKTIVLPPAVAAQNQHHNHNNKSKDSDLEKDFEL